MCDTFERNVARAKEFMRHLSTFLKGDNHIERELGDVNSTVELVCFAEHMRQANNLMAEPYTPAEIINLIIPITGFTQDVVPGDAQNAICKELGEVLDELIEDGVI
ncbi:uncharacterized protein LOC112688439 [Sipha flava]|uniref:Uncharacterized protein LOC112688439 n=1 Tax=Sipha flava TaxID=143950 RepID=A0A2S2QVH2_9HEMI|nr:uncharacterized protein LOC112688439 [Sipha flava]